MPQHVAVSPEEDLEAFSRVPPYTRVAGASPPSPASTPDRSASRPAASPPAATSLSTPAPLASSPASPPAGAPAPSPIIAVILSLVLPGAGEIYVGQLTKGIVLAVVGVPTLGCCGVLSLVTAIDSYLLAQRRQRGETIADWQFF